MGLQKQFDLKNIFLTSSSLVANLLVIVGGTGRTVAC